MSIEQKHLVVKWLFLRREFVSEFDTLAEAEAFVASDESLDIITVPVGEGYLNSTGAVKEMSRKILIFVSGYQPATYAELIPHLGKDAEGDFNFFLPGHTAIVLWSGVSLVFADAFNLVKDSLFEEPCGVMIYMMDGQALNLPIATSADHKTLHWLPSVLSIRTEEHKRMLAEAVRKREQRENRKAARAGRAA